VKDLYMKITNHQRKKFKNTSEDGRFSQVQVWQNLYCDNGCTTKINLYIQCNSHQYSGDIYHRGWKSKLTFHMEAQKIIKSRGNHDITETELFILLSYPTRNFSTIRDVWDVCVTSWHRTLPNICKYKTL
jgi:hypothetical protein